MRLFQPIRTFLSAYRLLDGAGTCPELAGAPKLGAERPLASPGDRLQRRSTSLDEETWPWTVAAWLSAWEMRSRKKPTKYVSSCVLWAFPMRLQALCRKQARSVGYYRGRS